ncbi:hypothetical protein B0H13DRAFT_1636642, partial [Mycena leptocephala]
LKSYKVSLEDLTWKILPAALKKFRINDNWENYAMIICYGSVGNRVERCISYDEKPLLLFQKLKDAKKNPFFMLKHIKDIRSPIAVAQQKYATRKASSIMSNGSATSSTRSASSRPLPWPLKLEVDLNTGQGVAPTTSPAPAWLGHENLKRSNTNSSDATPATAQEMPLVSTWEASYAVAIFPYMAEQDDEVDIAVGDTFVILSRARGWWVVQRDPTGSGIVDRDGTKQAWAPAGCFLETNVPVASAIAEATVSTGPGSSRPGSPPETPVSKTPILPLSIISTSFPGIALMDYKKKEEEELDLVKDNALRVYKRYNHWSYAVKEEGGDRGWVPSWFIGKVATGPATPSTSVPPPLTSSIMDDKNQAQASLMSSAFPTVQTGSSVSVNQHPRPF